MHWQRPDRNGIAYVQGCGDKLQSIRLIENRWQFSSDDDVMWHWLNDALVAYIPGPPPEGMTEAGPVVVPVKDSNSGRVAHVIATEAYAKLIYGDGESRDTTRRNSLVNVAALCAVLNEHYTIAPSDLAKLPAWVREGIK